MMKPSCLPVAERTADGPVSVALTKGGAWREDAAGDIPSRIAEAMLLLQHHPATLILATSCPSVAKTSVKGETGEWGSERNNKVKDQKKKTKLYPYFYFSLNLV